MKLILAAAISMFASIAHAAPVCFDTSGFKDNMEKGGNEKIFSGLVSDDSHALEIWVAQTGEWVVVVTLPDGSTCPVNGGLYYIGPLPNA